jgi:hypothetical protein
MRSASELIPRGLFDPVWWRNSRCKIAKTATINGRIKWKAKNRLSVALSTAKPPQIHSTSIFPTYGMAENRFVITVAPQNLIWPHGRTYPMNAAAMVRINRRTPIFHVSMRL